MSHSRGYENLSKKSMKTTNATQNKEGHNQATPFFANASLISLNPLSSASSRPSRMRAFCGFRKPLSIVVSLSVMATSPLPVRVLRTTGRECVDAMSSMAS